MSSEFSTLSDFSWAKVNKGSVISNQIDTRYPGTKEIWESEYPTRTDISDIDTVKEIVPYLVIVLCFVQGLIPKQYEISRLLRTDVPETLFINLARGGSGNNRIITRLEQWTNDKNSEKTKTIIIGFSSMYRFDYYMDIGKPNTIGDRISIYDTTEIRGYDIMPDYIHQIINNEDDNKDKVLRPLKDVWKDIVGKQTSYVNTMLKNLETNIRRLDWITRSKKWNVIYIENESWGDSLHDNDKKVINKYLQEMDKSRKKI